MPAMLSLPKSTGALAGARPSAASLGRASVPSSAFLRHGGVLGSQGRCVSRAADVEQEQGENLLDNFSFSDAKKANAYSIADVQQALAYYSEGEVFLLMEKPACFCSSSPSLSLPLLLFGCSVMSRKLL